MAVLGRGGWRRAMRVREMPHRGSLRLRAGSYAHEAKRRMSPVEPGQFPSQPRHDDPHRKRRLFVESLELTDINQQAVRRFYGSNPRSMLPAGNQGQLADDIAPPKPSNRDRPAIDLLEDFDLPTLNQEDPRRILTGRNKEIVHTKMMQVSSYLTPIVDHSLEHDNTPHQGLERQKHSHILLNTLINPNLNAMSE